MKRVTLAAAIMLSAGMCFANVPGGGDGKGADVSVKDDGDSIVLDNGIVAIRINKQDATIGSFRYRGMNLFEGGHNGGRFYWSWNTPAYGGPRGNATINASGSDYAEVKIHSPWSGQTKDAAMDVDIYYSLKRGAQGFYVTAVLNHPASYPRVEVGEWRSNAYVSPMFDWLSVDALRQRKMPTVDDMASSVAVAGAPKEVRMLTTGQYAGQYECKYAYSADLGELSVWGWSSTSKRVGIWMTVPSHEYYNGGPMKRELTVHMDHTLLNMLNGSHYSMGAPLTLAAGSDVKKTYGPYLVYANSYQGAASDTSSSVTAALWQDAQAQAAAEQAAWPYTWFKNPDYVPAAGRGSVSGILKVNDSGNPSAHADGAWIGLAPDQNGLGFQHQASSYQFWVKVGAGGRFSIPNVLPGRYHLWAFGANNVDAFERTDIEVRAGTTQDLGIVEWKPSRVAATVWEIGIPDRDSREFQDGEFNYTQWATYARARDQEAALTYTVGKSDWRRDWQYAQFGTAPWTIKFALANTPPKDAPASLYIALASSETTLNVTLNGKPIGSYTAPYPSHAPVRLGSHGGFSATRLSIPPGLLKQGENNIVITQSSKKGKPGTTQYDYLRLEADGL
ncbi:polysaccharide lyase family protein [Duganella guangzhouensis]|nr:polysaccharide lyase family protein [Duganella guangzhouensis]